MSDPTTICPNCGAEHDTPELLDLQAQVAALEGELQTAHTFRIGLMKELDRIADAITNPVWNRRIRRLAILASPSTAPAQEGDMDPLEFNLVQNPPYRKPDTGEAKDG